MDSVPLPTLGLLPNTHTGKFSHTLIGSLGRGLSPARTRKGPQALVLVPVCPSGSALSRYNNAS